MFSTTNPWLVTNVLSSILGLFLLCFWLFIFLQFRAFEGDSGNYSSRTQLLQISSIFALIGGIITGLIISGLQLVLMLGHIDSLIRLIFVNISICSFLLSISYCLLIFSIKI